MTQVAERFEEDVREHELQIVRDDGLYRHLRCQKPGTYIYGFDLVTWPGYLAYVGDMGDFLFSRIRDMFEFFRGSPSPDYWSEKLQGPGPACDAVLEYDESKFEAIALDRALSPGLAFEEPFLEAALKAFEVRTAPAGLKR